jgi:hypothetical protein
MRLGWGRRPLLERADVDEEVRADRERYDAVTRLLQERIAHHRRLLADERARRARRRRWLYWRTDT